MEELGRATANFVVYVLDIDIIQLFGSDRSAGSTNGT